MDAKRLLEYAIATNPTRIELELTERCNQSCVFCYNSQKPIDSYRVMDVLYRLSEEGVPEIVLTGGEPILHPDFKDIVHRCAVLFQKTMLQTNGTMIDDSLADFLAENDIYEVNISLHGPQKLHDTLTSREGSYQQATAAMKRLIDRKVRVSSNFVMTKENIHGLKNNLVLLRQLGVHMMTLTRFTPTGVGSMNAQLALSQAEIVEAINVVERFYQENPDVMILLANSMPYCALPSSLSHYCSHCHFGASRFYVDIHGNVLMCGMSRVKLGNILQDTFANIKGQSHEFARHIFGTDVPEQCATCVHFRQCRGGCRAAALATTGNLYGADPYKI